MMNRTINDMIHDMYQHVKPFSLKIKQKYDNHFLVFKYLLRFVEDLERMHYEG